MKNLRLPILLLVLLTVLAGCGDSRDESENLSSEELLLKAQLLIDRKQGDAAIRELKLALQKDENNARARFLLGKLYFENQELMSASKELERALELGHSTSETSTLLARVYLSQKKYSDLQAINLDQLRDTDKGTVLALQGMSLIRSGSADKGKKLVAEAVRWDPSNEESRLTYGRLLADKGDLIGARAQAEAILMENDANYGAWMLLGNIEFVEGQLTPAEEAYTQAMAVAPNPTEAQLKRSQLRIERGNFEQAQADVDNLKRRLPASPSVQYVQAIIHFKQERYGKALASLAIAEKDLQRHPEALLYSGISHNKLGNHDQARSYANQYRNLKPTSVYGRRLLASIAVSLGEYNEAEKQLRTLVDANPEDVASLNLLANTYLARGDTEPGLDLLARVVELEPGSSIALGRLAAGQLLAGEPSVGVRYLESALAIEPHFEQAEILLVLTLIQQGEIDKALAATESYRQRNLGATAPLNLLARVYLAAEQPKQARNAYLKALEIDPGDASAHHGLARLDLAQNDIPAAKAHYEAVLAVHENHLPTLLELAKVSAAQNDIDSMLAYLQQAIDHHPYTSAPRVLLAQYYLTINKPSKVSLLISEMDEEMKSHPDVLKVAALAQLEQGDFLRARYAIDELAMRLPGAAEVHYLRALLYAALEENEPMEQELISALEISPDHTQARFMLARSYLSESRFQAAEPHLQRLAELVPDSAELMLLEAAAARARGDQRAAIAYAEQAFSASPETTTLLHLVGYLHLQGDYEREKLLLSQWIAQHPGDTQARIAQANMSALLEDYSTAIVQYREVLLLDENNTAALNGLAWYLKESQPEEALQFAEKLTALDPDSAATQDTLAMVLLTNGEIMKADWAINRALRQDPANPTVRYHSALISARAGKRDEARERLESLLLTESVFPERKDAEALLREISSGR